MRRAILAVGERVRVGGRIGTVTEVFATQSGVKYTVLHAAEHSGLKCGGELIPCLWGGPADMVRRATKTAKHKRKGGAK